MCLSRWALVGIYFMNKITVSIKDIAVDKNMNRESTGKQWLNEGERNGRGEVVAK